MLQSHGGSHVANIDMREKYQYNGNGSNQSPSSSSSYSPQPHNYGNGRNHENEIASNNGSNRINAGGASSEPYVSGMTR